MSWTSPADQSANGEPPRDWRELNTQWRNRLRIGHGPSLGTLARTCSLSINRLCLRRHLAGRRTTYRG